MGKYDAEIVALMANLFTGTVLIYGTHRNNSWIWYISIFRVIRHCRVVCFECSELKFNGLINIYGNLGVWEAYAICRLTVVFTDDGKLLRELNEHLLELGFVMLPDFSSRLSVVCFCLLEATKATTCEALCFAKNLPRCHFETVFLQLQRFCYNRQELSTTYFKWKKLTTSLPGYWCEEPFKWDYHSMPLNDAPENWFFK